TLPYWDWSAYNQDWIEQPNKLDTGNLASAFHCFVDDSVLAALAGKIDAPTLAKLASVKGRTFDSSNRLFLAAGLVWKTTANRPAIVAALQQANPLWHPFRWPGASFSSGQPNIFENYPRPDDDDRLLALDAFFTFGSGPANNHYYGALETVHNLLHLFSGGQNPNYDAAEFPNPTNRIEPLNGDMFSNSTTTRDPFFWCYHSNVDRLWDLWQQRHPGAGPDNPAAPLPPFDLTVADTASVHRLGYEYQLASSVFETDPTTPLARFKSAPADVHPHALAHHARAEVRLHGLRHAIETNGVLRVFLNEPDADATTPTKGNPHYVGQFATFGGGCVGGPGHCAAPTGPRLLHDRRHRHPKTPGNVRLDATAVVAALRARGDTDFHVHVVVVGLDGRPHPELLRLSAVSLNFFD
ncbi:MAG: hypothetical protein RLZZ15_3659, partial [Verrucomicrobiota bacterium]